MRTSVTRELGFDYGHRLIKHEGRCSSYHGHRARVLVTVEAPALDDVGRVVDFSVIKDQLGTWLDNHFDHGMLLQAGDPMLALYEQYPHLRCAVLDVPPTAEHLAEIIFKKAEELLPAPLVVTRVRFFETPNCYADVART